jgi:hypothetical protein
MTNPTRKPDQGKRKTTNRQLSSDRPRNWPGAAPNPFTQEEGSMPTGKPKTNTSKNTTSKKNVSTLTAADLAKLEQSYITQDLAEDAGIYRVDTHEGARIVGRTPSKGHDYAGLIIPNVWPGETHAREFRLRRDNPDQERKTDGSIKEKNKYLSPPGKSNLFYIPPGTPVDWLADPTIPATFTEGEKKALALFRYYQERGEKRLVIGLYGVWGWRGVVGKTTNGNGQRQDVHGAIPDFDKIVWKDRDASIVFDVNVSTNESVAAARNCLANELNWCDASVSTVDLPDSAQGVNGIDDLLKIEGPDFVTNLFASASAAAHVGVGPYRETPTGIIREAYDKQQKVMIDIKVSNFTARIIGDITEDDGESQKRSYELIARLNGHAPQFCVSAEDFNLMKWTDIQLGAKAIIQPGQGEHVRCAIRTLSPQPTVKRIFTHTGWREIDGEMCYLHGGGAIGAQDVKPVSVHLLESLAPVYLPNPPTGAALEEVVRNVFDLMLLAPLDITVPTMGGAFSSVIGRADFTLWLYGQTGTFKTALAVIIQAFWGAGFKADELKTILPGSWLSSGGSLEFVAHAAKDMLCVIDDFKPTTRQERDKLYRDADRLLRAQGNNTGRQRLTSDIRLRKTYSPRGLILVTAEEMPKFESLIARLFVVETHKSSIDVEKLTEAQSLAARGIYASAMAAFIRWLAANHAKVIKGAPTEIVRERDKWAGRNIATHRRYATTLAHLFYGWSLFIQFAEGAGAITGAEALAYRADIDGALATAGAKQDAHADVENPVTRFISLLQSAFASQRAHLESREGGAPASSVAWGWRYASETVIDSTGLQAKLIERHTPCGERIGWHAGEEIYLLPDATFALLERIAPRDGGVGVSQSTLWKHLYEAGIITKESKRETYTVRRRIGGHDYSVLVVFSGKLLSCAEKPDKPDNGD